jgi:hypothetical protein
VLILATIEQFEMLIFYFIYVLEEKSIMDNDIQAMNQDEATPAHGNSIFFF